jgi:hypothetical protein
MDRIDLHNALIATMLCLVWLAVAAAMIRVGHPPSSTTCWAASAVCAILLSGRVIAEGIHQVRTNAGRAGGYLWPNIVFVVVASVFAGQLGQGLTWLMQRQSTH